MFRTSINGAARIISEKPLTIEALARSCPSAFAEAPHESRSHQYKYIPTHKIVTAMAGEGFFPFSAMQSGSRDKSKREKTKHLIRFRHVDSKPIIKGLHHEICLINSHDGSSSYRLMAGMFRMACSNGLIVSEGALTEVRVPHKGEIERQVIEGSYQLTQTTPLLAEKVEEMQSIVLSDPEAEVFAKAALVARFGVKEEYPITPEQVLRRRRQDDCGADLWSTFNAAQENLMKGGQRTRNPSDPFSRRKTREVGSVDGNIQTNRALWALASEMAKLKAL